MLRTSALLFALATLLASGTAPARAETPPTEEAAPEGKIVLIRDAPDALILWDATDRIVTLRAAKTSTDDIVKTLESETARVALSLADKTKSAKTVSVRIIFARIVGVSQSYGSQQLQGIERLVIVTYPTTDLATKASDYEASLLKGETPADVKIDKPGKLAD